MVNAPRHDQVDRQAVAQATDVCELARLDTTPTLEDPVIDLDTPAPCIPRQAFERVLFVPDRDGGEQHPFKPLDLGRRVCLLAQVHQMGRHFLVNT